MSLVLPRRRRGRPTQSEQARYAADLDAFCTAILEIRSRLDFEVSSRGWCYVLEPYGLHKGEFDAAEETINGCRKTGKLPLDICAEDNGRKADNLETIDPLGPEDEAAEIVESIGHRHLIYTPFSFWHDKDFYIEMMVEKVDLKSLFSRNCGAFHIPLANAKGWADINSRAAMMRRFKKWEGRGKQAVLLYCGDFDPAGLVISDFLRSNLAELSDAVGWSPDNLIVDRFGLNHDFIEVNDLTWIESLETGSGKRLDDRKHPDHFKPYVQNYIAKYGIRKVEANALVVKPREGRELCRKAITKYLPEDAPIEYRAALEPEREKLRQAIAKRLLESGSTP
jgi:hypothetical protein